jgi:WD40 repeat protein
MLLVSSFAMAKDHPYFISNMAISNDAKYIAVSRLDNKIIVFNRENQKTFKVLEDANHSIHWLVVFTPDSKYFVFQHYDNSLMFYDLKKEKIAKKVVIGYPLSSIAFFKDNNTFIVGGLDGKIEVINISTKDRKTLKPRVPDAELSDFFTPISSIKISHDENYFVTTTYTGDWREEPEQDLELIERKKVPSGNIYEDWNVKHIGLNLWDAKTFTKIKKMKGNDLSGHTYPIFSSDGKYILVACDGASVSLWDVPSGDLIKGTQGGGGNQGIGFLANDNSNIVGLAMGPNPFLALYRLQDFINEKDPWFYKKIKISPIPCTGAIVTDPSRNLIVVGTEDGSISVYKFNPQTLDIELEWHPKSIISGLIGWISPSLTMFKRTDEINEMVQKYEVEQLRQTEKEREQETVETEYETIEVK